ncbi:phage gp16-like protein [Novosphingobium sp. 1748]|uniref:gp16 family protein n=1 Tax=Novosphingobium sp. 1748 TaxID=2817760 RepID=UPI002861E576|nr:regulatory protein GemA [Novosphingobium sp. 1748]MDR6708146.1 phage gp16-like protein [Novosphingobium sp. 1748]
MSAVRARPAQFDRASQNRRSMIAKIQIAKAQIGLDEDDYRQAVFDASGQFSLAGCNDGQLIRLLDWMKSKGFRPLPKGGTKAASHPMARKARALWISLYHLGAVHNSSEQALEAFAKRQLHCDRLVWANQGDAFRLIEALKSWAIREGWIQHDRATQKPLSPLGLQASLCSAILQKLKAAKVAPEGWTLDQAAFKLCGIETDRTERGYSAEDYERLAAALGDVLRKHGGRANG